MAAILSRPQCFNWYLPYVVVQGETCTEHLWKHKSVRSVRDRGNIKPLHNTLNILRQIKLLRDVKISWEFCTLYGFLVGLCFRLCRFAAPLRDINFCRDHDDVIKWKHFPRYWPFVRGIHRSPVNSPHKGQWRGVLMFSLICARISGWANSREAGDLRRHRAHYDVIVMTEMCYEQKMHLVLSLSILETMMYCSVQYTVRSNDWLPDRLWWLQMTWCQKDAWPSVSTISDILRHKYPALQSLNPYSSLRLDKLYLREVGRSTTRWFLRF